MQLTEEVNFTTSKYNQTFLHILNLMSYLKIFSWILPIWFIFTAIT